MRRAPVVSLVAAACAGAAVWFSCGALAVTGASTVTRVGLLPAWYWLPMAILLGAAVAWAVRLSSEAALPLFLSLLLLLPWIPGPVPAAFLLWTGHMVPVVWLTIGLIRLGSDPICTKIVKMGSDPRRGRAYAGVLAFALYLFAGWQLSPILPGGDEPHYLILAQSLLGDGDIKIENNHTRGDYREYFGGDLRPHFLKRGTNGEIYSVHAPGLPAVIAPAFALFGYPGVVVFLCAVAAFGSWLLWTAAYTITSSISAAWFTWAAGALTVPIAFESFAIYPDGIGGTLVLLAAIPLISGQSRGEGQIPTPEPVVGSVVLSGAILGLLPWLHTRFSVISAALGVAIVLRLVSRGERSRIVTFLALPVVSAIAWFSFFRSIYGTFNPAAPYGGDTQSAPVNILNGLPALFFDQQFGILPNAPVYAVCFLGMFVLAKRHRRLALELSAVAGAYLLSTSAFFMWWGGSSAPARFAVPVLPLLVLPAAVWWDEKGRATALVALFWSIATTIVFASVDNGRLAYNFRDGYARATDWLTAIVDLAAGLPSFFRQSPPGAVFRAAIWIFSFAAAIALLRRVTRRDTRRGMLALATPLSLAAGVMLALSIVWSIDGVAAVIPEGSQLDLLSSFDRAARPLAIRYSPMTVESAGQVVSELSISTPVQRGAPPAGVLLLAPGIVPAGRYELRASEGAVLTGRAALVIGRNARPIKTWNLATTFADGSALLELPVSVGSLIISGDRGHLNPVLSLHPLEIYDGAKRLTSQFARRAERYGAATIFFYDEGAFVEEAGFWVRGSGETQFAAASDQREASVELMLRNAPVPNTVSIDIDGAEQVLEMTPGEERAVSVKPVGGHAAALVRIRTNSGFRPSLVEPNSTDTRFLGVRVDAR